MAYFTQTIHRSVPNPAHCQTSETMRFVHQYPILFRAAFIFVITANMNEKTVLFSSPPFTFLPAVAYSIPLLGKQRSLRNLHSKNCALLFGYWTANCAINLGSSSTALVCGGKRVVHIIGLQWFSVLHGPNLSGEGTKQF